MTLRHRIRFYQQLAVSVSAGVPILTNLTRLKERMRGKETMVLLEKVRAGERLGAAFVAAGFSPIECHLVTAGEESGHLDTIFQHLSEYWDRELKLRQQIVLPLVYPVILIHLAILVQGIIEYCTKGYELPHVIALFIIRMTLFYAISIGAYVFTLVTWSNDVMRQFWIRVPLIGGALSTAYSYRWITALKLEFIAGIPLSRAIGDAWRSSGFLGCNRRAAEGEEGLRQGTPLSELMRRWGQLPRDWVDFMETAELSGALEATFTRLEEEAAHAWSLAQQRLTLYLPKILYSVLIVIIGWQALRIGKQEYVDPIVDMEKQIDNGFGGK